MYKVIINCRTRKPVNIGTGKPQIRETINWKRTTCMKRVLGVIVATVITVSSFAQALKPVDEEGAVRFKIKNLGFNTTGAFSGLQGTIQFDPAHLANASFDVSVDANTVNTGVDLRDNHLRKEEYFDVKNHPRIQFVSTKVTPSNKSGTFFITGKLTLKGVTKEISFPFTATANTEGYLFSGEFKINRKDFKISAGSTISDNLTVMLNVTAKKG